MSDRNPTKSNNRNLLYSIELITFLQTQVLPNSSHKQGNLLPYVKLRTCTLKNHWQIILCRSLCISVMLRSCLKIIVLFHKDRITFNYNSSDFQFFSFHLKLKEKSQKLNSKLPRRKESWLPKDLEHFVSLIIKEMEKWSCGKLFSLLTLLMKKRVL